MSVLFVVDPVIMDTDNCNGMLIEIIPSDNSTPND